ncbi:nucleoside diphosphate kinase [Paraphysoderma sedebokerense]|nr:nucleoside diphosphate kinase [Paraphysoderma sedebokerense]
MAQRTLAIIKPDAYQHENHIIHIIQQNGFDIIDKKRIHLTVDQATEFYSDHIGKSFFNALVNFMISGPIIVLCLYKDNSITEWRSLIGPTDSKKARETAPNSVRAQFGTDNQRNAVHGSDSDVNAEREIKFFFPNAPVDQLPTNRQIKEYLEKVLYPVLSQGLTQLCKEKPGDPAEWLGKWLLHNNPNKPRVIEPDN